MRRGRLLQDEPVELAFDEQGRPGDGARAGPWPVWRRLRGLLLFWREQDEKGQSGHQSTDYVERRGGQSEEQRADRRGQSDGQRRPQVLSQAVWLVRGRAHDADNAFNAVRLDHIVLQGAQESCEREDAAGLVSSNSRGHGSSRESRHCASRSGRSQHTRQVTASRDYH